MKTKWEKIAYWKGFLAGLGTIDDQDLYDDTKDNLKELGVKNYSSFDDIDKWVPRRLKYKTRR